MRNLSPIRVRKPGLEDIDELARLWGELIEDYNGDDGIIYDETVKRGWLNYIKNIIASNNSNGRRILVAEVDNRIVGYMLYEIIKPSAKSRYSEHVYISDLVVDREYRRKGIASLLLENLLKVPEGLTRRIFLRVPAKNVIAVNFYAKHGFKISEYVMELVVA